MNKLFKPSTFGGFPLSLLLVALAACSLRQSEPGLGTENDLAAAQPGARTALIWSGGAPLTQGVCGADAFVLSSASASALTYPAGVALHSMDGSLRYFTSPDCADGSETSRVVLTSRSDKKELHLLRTLPGAALAVATPNRGAAPAATVTVQSYAAVNVRTPPSSVLSAAGDGMTDDSPAFQSAIDYASSTASRTYPAGPNGSSQAIVYVPPGKYLVRRVLLKSNVRLEVSAGATLSGFGYDKRGIPAKCENYLVLSTPDATTTPAAPPLTNVSVVGVGFSKQGKPAPAEGWQTYRSFVIDHDPLDQKCDLGIGNPQNALGQPFSTLNAAILVENVDGFLIENIYSYQRNDSPGAYYPKEVVRFVSGMIGKKVDTTPDMLNEPRHGTYRNHFNVGSAAGWGPNQFQSASQITVDSIYSEGGVALRLETGLADNLMAGKDCPATDPRCHSYGARVDQVKASRIWCRRGNAAVYLSSHTQVNGAVDIRDIDAQDCYTALTEESGLDDNTKHFAAGYFEAVRVNGVVARGSNFDAGSGTCFDCRAQKANPEEGTWTLEASLTDVLVRGSAAHGDDHGEHVWGTAATSCKSFPYFSSGGSKNCVPVP